jgi:flagellar basal-body rod modification protein FlgD
LTLLTAQLRYQDPTNPTDATAFVAQLASFSSVEQGIRTNTKLDSLITSLALSQADGTIGRTVTSEDGSVTGQVASVRIISGGAVAILTSGEEVNLEAGVRISQ